MCFCKLGGLVLWGGGGGRRTRNELGGWEGGDVPMETPGADEHVSTLEETDPAWYA